MPNEIELYIEALVPQNMKNIGTPQSGEKVSVMQINVYSVSGGWNVMIDFRNSTRRHCWKHPLSRRNK